jgi:hypothetical protein
MRSDKNANSTSEVADSRFYEDAEREDHLNSR